MVDAHGRVRQYHFGEGEYERSEIAIQRLLSEAGVADGGESVVSVNADGVEGPADWESLKSGENYLGYDQKQNFASPGGAIVDRPRVHSPISAHSLSANRDGAE